MLVAVVSTAGVLALWLLPIILGCGALSIAYCLQLQLERRIAPISALFAVSAPSALQIRVIGGPKSSPRKLETCSGVDTLSHSELVSLQFTSSGSAS